MKKRPDFGVRWVTVGPGPKWPAIFFFVLLERTDEAIVGVEKSYRHYSDSRSDRSCDLSQQIAQV